MKRNWVEYEINYLIENFSDNFTLDIAKHLNRSEKSIIKKAHKLGLIKSKRHKSICISRRNKLVGHQWNIDELQIIAQKYKCRSEFQKNNSAAYSAAKKMGVLDDICFHMISKSFSVPQIILKKIISKLFNTKIIYNDRKILKPYEIDVYLPEINLGFEYNGKGWHIDNKNDLLKSEKAKEKNITLITIVENTRNYITDIKSQLINKIDILNQFIEIEEETIVSTEIENPYNEIYDVNQLINICNNFSSFKEFYTKKKSIYVKISKLGLIEKCTSHMCCRRKKRNLDEVKYVISKYETLLEFIKKESGTYQYIKKNNLENLISHLKRLN